MGCQKIPQCQGWRVKAIPLTPPPNNPWQVVTLILLYGTEEHIFLPNTEPKCRTPTKHFQTFPGMVTKPRGGRRRGHPFPHPLPSERMLSNPNTFDAPPPQLLLLVNLTLGPATFHTNVTPLPLSVKCCTTVRQTLFEIGCNRTNDLENYSRSSERAVFDSVSNLY